MLPVDGGSARDLRAAVICGWSGATAHRPHATTHRPDACAQAPGRRFLSLVRKEEKEEKKKDQPAAPVSARWLRVRLSMEFARGATRGPTGPTSPAWCSRSGFGGTREPFRFRNPRTKIHPRQPARRRQRCQTCGAGRLVDRTSCGALSTGVTAGPRVLQSLVAGADRIAALRSRPLVVGLCLTRHPPWDLSAECLVLGSRMALPRICRTGPQSPAVVCHQTYRRNQLYDRNSLANQTA